MNPYLIPIIESFVANANPENARWMKKYMKERFEFFGIKKPERTVLQKKFFSTERLPTSDDLPLVCKDLFMMKQREYQYFAIDLLGKSERNWNEKTADVLEELIITKSWWETVDLLAAKLAGKFFEKFPSQIQNYTGKWNASANIWLVRSSILFQLNYKEKTNRDLLFNFILPHAGSTEFFIQKPIGWSLRQYARVAPNEVIEFVNQNQLKPLSKREALKHLR